MKKRSKIILGVVAFVLLIAAMLTAFFMLREKPDEGTKSISIQVVNSTGETKEYKFKTDVLYLRQAMDEAKEKGLEYSGVESTYGLMVDTVNGEFAEFNTNGAYWSFYVNDAYCNCGIDTQPVNDGDVFKIVYTKS